jgi:hypothetical protein
VSHSWWKKRWRNCGSSWTRFYETGSHSRDDALTVRPGGRTNLCTATPITLEWWRVGRYRWTGAPELTAFSYILCEMEDRICAVCARRPCFDGLIILALWCCWIFDIDHDWHCGAVGWEQKIVGIYASMCYYVRIVVRCMPTSPWCCPIEEGGILFIDASMWYHVLPVVRCVTTFLWCYNLMYTTVRPPPCASGAARPGGKARCPTTDKVKRASRPTRNHIQPQTAFHPLSNPPCMHSIGFTAVSQ